MDSPVGARCSERNRPRIAGESLGIVENPCRKVLPMVHSRAIAHAGVPAPCRANLDLSGALNRR